MTVGHPGLSTLHAEDMGKLVDRLTTEPIALPPTLLENLDVIVFLTKTTRKGTYIRRVKQIFEMVRWDPKENAPVVNEVFRWEPVTDTFKSIEGSIILKEIATERGVSEKEIIRDMHKRSDVLRWMFEKNIRDYRDVGKILRLFYADPKRLFAKIGAG
jgi:flagellar protein FlaI